MDTLKFSDIKVKEFNRLLKTNFNPNSPKKYGTTSYQSFAWAKSALNELGITFDDEINSAWALFSKLDNINMRYIKKSKFREGVQNGFDNNTLAKIIPNGSIVFGYFVGNPYVFRSIDEMFSLNLSLGIVKQLFLRPYLKLDDIPNVNEDTNDFGWYDSTPISQMKFSEEGFKTKWDNVKNKILIGKKLPFVPINHIGIFANGHLLHYCSDILVEPSDSLRIVAYYDFKTLFLIDAAKRFGQAVVNSEIVQKGLALVATATNSSESLTNLKDASDIIKITKKFNI
jgi:hypothetical protein